MRVIRFAALTAMAAALALTNVAASAQDKLKLALGQRGNWDTAIAELGQQAGIFKKRGLELEILWTQGAGESQQAVISGSVDIGLAGTLAAFGAYQKGAPLRIIAAEATGAADFWYVKADSPIKTIKDLDGKTIAYSTNGASTHTLVLAFLKAGGAAGKPIATGGPSQTFTQVMSGQVDVGWSAPPFGLEALKENRIRIIARASDVAVGRNQTIRSLVTTATVLDTRADALRRFVQGYRETIDWMYSSDDALKAYAAFAKISFELAKRVRDEFFPKNLVWPDKVSGLDTLMQDGVTFKYLREPLTAAQVSEMVRIPAPMK
ncbi:MAG TPA: ABC transporter substrate-binding protein [Xanthobacteraceae bacterium]|nr:ABC transporter substrate-binding protein [Xanthobacteraceae bacterium]